MKTKMKRKSNFLKIVSSATFILFASQPWVYSVASPKENSNTNLTTKLKDVKLITQVLDNSNQEVLIPNPTIKIDGKPVQPTQPSPPPFLPRAVAPPVGDMAVSNVNSSPPVVDLSTSSNVPRLVLREAPVREVLSLLSRAAGLNIIFTDSESEGDSAGSTISLDLENEPIQDVFNSVLTISGLKANRQGQTIYVGTNLPPAIRNTITRSIRLNQYSAIGAASFLNTQGAKGNILEVTQDEGGEGKIGKTTYTVKPLDSTAKEGEQLILTGLTVHADPIHDTITLVGEPHLVQLATSFLTQLDVRRRQVAVNVKVVDVQLNNDFSFGSSFSAGINDTGIVQDGGVGVINFGTSNQNLNNYGPDIITFEPVYPEDERIPEYLWGERVGAEVGQPAPTTTVGDGAYGVPNSGRISPYGNTSSGDTINANASTEAPSDFNVPNAFLAQLRATIETGNAKILTDPTLVVQEGQVASVELIENVVTSVNTSVDTDSGVRTVTPVIEPAGLTLSVAIQKIDDNGYINMATNPKVSAPGEEQSFDSGGGAVNRIRPLIERTLNSGLIRLRDGQTLILSGIISEAQRATVGKVPILGDLPIIGTLFRFTRNQNERNEVIVLLTPQIINDSNAYSGFGYNYAPSRETGEFLREQGLTVPSQP